MPSAHVFDDRVNQCLEACCALARARICAGFDRRSATAWLAEAMVHAQLQGHDDYHARRSLPAFFAKEECLCDAWQLGRDQAAAEDLACACNWEDED